MSRRGRKKKTKNAASRHSSPKSQKKKSCLEKSRTDNRDTQLEFTADVIDKQYRCYMWNDGKVQALVTIDAALIAGLLVLLQICSKRMPLLILGLLVLAFIPLVLSFFICLVHAIPVIHSGVGNEENLRTMVGIAPNDKQKYHSKIKALNPDEMLRMNCWQIVGMCKNNMRSRKLIRRGAILIVVGVSIFICVLPLILAQGLEDRVALQNGRMSAQSPGILRGDGNCSSGTNLNCGCSATRESVNQGEEGQIEQNKRASVSGGKCGNREVESY